jgi:hypothetical protein
LFNKKQGVFGHYDEDEDGLRLYLNNRRIIDVKYDARYSLPTGYARTGATPEPQVKVVQTSENQNLTGGQKLLLEWHNRVAHLNFDRVQQVLRNVPFIANKFVNAVRCEHPRCHTYALVKAKRCAKNSVLQTKVPERDGAPKVDNLKVGSRVSVDHFKSRLKGRSCDSYGNPSSTQYAGGALFVEHSSGYIKCEHQVGFSAVETICAKQNFECHCMDQGVVVQYYLTDNGAFKLNTFVAHINDSQQLLHVCGTNAHRQNGVAERAIHTISNMARAMILHAIMH